MDITRQLRMINYQDLLNEVPLGILLLDQNRRVLFYNKAIEALVGIPLCAAVGIPCYHVLRSRLCMGNCPIIKQTPLKERFCLESDLINRDHTLIPIRASFASLFDNAGRLHGYAETVEDLRLLKAYDQKLSQAYSFGHIVGKSAQMEKLFSIMPVIAQSDASVLITGETGTGKDMLAEAIHQSSERVKGPFVKINCGALPETLLESELFGHTKGAFTGAMENKQGRFHLAHNGTLYLTEIGDLPLTLQVKLLTFLDDKIVYPLGSNKGFEADVRIVAATHHNLEQMVKQGHFRKDLFFRLNVLRVHIPAVRERQGDIRLLLDHFLNHFSQKLERNIEGFSSRALKRLIGYEYPGNVRELRNIVEYAANMCQEHKIYPKHLPAYLMEGRQVVADEGDPRAVEAAAVVSKETMEAGSWPEVEKRMILEALVKSKGNRSRTAALLGFARSTLWRKMRYHGIDAS